VNANRPGIDKAGIVSENKLWLQKLPNPAAAEYHSYREVTRELQALARRHPDLCECVSLGKTHHGRDIWALRVGNSAKPGVVITGCHHAREWMSVEVPLESAHRLVTASAQGDPEALRRTREAEVWFVPVVNPDGYEYSRRYDNMWRKNRNPVQAERDGQLIRSVGVDPDRNYSGLYRDSRRGEQLEEGIDDPREEIYRGPHAASEQEAQAMVGLVFGHGNIRAVLDYHNYGESILFPWGHTRRHTRDHKLYEEIAETINSAAGGRMQAGQLARLYANPIPGGTEAAFYPNGVLTLTVELNGCFQPDPGAIEPTCERMHAANMALIDEVIDRAHQGKLPRRTPHPRIPDRL
jgi:carboxypeptidase T